jgi:hypothetical protein
LMGMQSVDFHTNNFGKYTKCLTIYKFY